MYGKIFESIYDGTIAVNWKGMVTFQQMIILCDQDGVIDITPPALSRRTGIPIDIIEEGIEFLEKEDPYSRSEKEGGRRIIRLDEHRAWGWQIVNHKHYRDLVTREDKRNYDKKRYQEKKSGKSENSTSEVKTLPKKVKKEDISQVSTDFTHEDEDTNTDTNKRYIPPVPDGVDSDLWKEYLKTRTRLKSPNSKRAITTLTNKIYSLVAKGYNANDLVETANERGWKSVFEPSGPAHLSNQSQQQTQRPRNEL